MSVKLNTRYLEGFVNENDVQGIAPEVTAAVELLNSRTGAGNDFLGWLDLPVDYDKEEFTRIKKAAEKIRSDSDVLVVIGIGVNLYGNDFPDDIKDIAGSVYSCTGCLLPASPLSSVDGALPQAAIVSNNTKIEIPASRRCMFLCFICIPSIRYFARLVFRAMVSMAFRSLAVL